MVSQNLKVGFDAHTLGKKATGNEVYAEGLIAGYTELQSQEFDFTLYVTAPIPQFEGQFKMQVIANSPVKRLVCDFPFLLGRDKPDVVHFQYISPMFCSVPTVLTVHDLSFLHHPECFPISMRKRLEWLVPRAIKKATHIVTPSHMSKLDIIKNYGLNEDEVSVVYNGVSEIFSPASEQRIENVQSKYGCSKPYLIVVGALQPRKNLKRVLEAYAEAIKSVKVMLDMRVVGPKRWKQHSIVDLASKLGISERVRVVGYVDEPDLVALYSGAQFSVYASLFEGFGLPIIESMACGTPVITSNTSCMPEISGGAALLVEPTDTQEIMQAIVELSNNQQLRLELKRKGIVNSEKFCWKNAASQMQDIYRSVAQTQLLHNAAENS